MVGGGSMFKSTQAVAMGAAILLAALAGGCASSAATPAPGAASASPVATDSPTALVTPSATDDPNADGIPPPSFPAPPVDTSNLPLTCDPGLIPTASPQPSYGAPANPRLALHVPILEYHRVVPFAQAGSSLRSLVVPPAVFDEQMRSLSTAGWHTITAAELGQDLVAGIKPAHKTLVVTFDDGWWDGYTNAFPILQKYGFVGTFYVITSRLNQTDGMTADQWNALVAAGDEIGDHTVSHLPLAHLSATSARQEIIRAAQTIAQVTGHWPETVAYPYGSFNQKVVGILGSCHPFLLAETTYQSVLEAWGTRFEVPRLKITSGTTAAELLRKLAPYV
jgi:peptidoglycan/xylan/chitin deacetylase (PgdA/CDA1 family)